MPLSVQGTNVFAKDIDMAGYLHGLFESGGITSNWGIILFTSSLIYNCHRQHTQVLESIYVAHAICVFVWASI